MSLAAGGRLGSRRVLQFFLALVGAVALGAGLATVLLGVKSIPGAGEVSATVESELRFYAVWYVGAGGVLLRAARRVEVEGATIRALAGFLFLAGCARGLSWLAVGRPHPLMVALMAVELGLPFVIVPWQAVVARRGASIRVEGEGVPS
jgi:hypothetical protein